MHHRYVHKPIVGIWEDANKLLLWQEVELAVIRARLKQQEVGLTEELVVKIETKLRATPIDLDWWHKRDEELRHDLNAFLDERRRHLLPEEAIWFHKDMTSYDTEEAPFAIMLRSSVKEVVILHLELKAVLDNLARVHRFSVMEARTHGQEAELQSFGRRVLSWDVELSVARKHLTESLWVLEYSKLSGAIGNYGGLNPELEVEALGILGFEPFYGATQIMPRSLYTSLANALFTMVGVVAKIANDIRLSARSGRPLMREPFGKLQRGSSAMPNKKNTITTEQLEGMRRMAAAYLQMILENVSTWEERAIEQSCVERVAWVDLFHVTCHSLKSLTKVVSGLTVYPDKMLEEIADSHGCYASAEAKEVLKELGQAYGLLPDEAYLIVQLAAFNAHAPSETDQTLRDQPPKSLAEATVALTAKLKEQKPGDQTWKKLSSIQGIIECGHLVVSPELAAEAETVDRWNNLLLQIFQSEEARARWDKVFSFEYLLRNEHVVFEKVLN